MAAQVHQFQTEVKQLLDLMIHSLYSNKEIFLRELISNSSDALDKLRFEEITNKDLIPSEKELSIFVSCDPEAHTLVIEDNGIGMDHDEIVLNLGTIANSGTRKFLDSLSEAQKQDANLIGQFGVGFYSAFMVAQEITVESLSARGGQAHRWHSTGDGTYTLEPCEKTTRGTTITVKLKEDDKEFADNWKIKGIIKKYSDYVTYPIFMAEKQMEKTGEGDDAPEIEVTKDVRINQTTPVWVKRKSENKTEDYEAFYRQISSDWQPPLVWEHWRAEGTLSFHGLVFVPSKTPFDLYSRQDQYGLHLYVKRVSIMEKCKELVPEYLRFISGVVETDDLPLNVSREILQQNNKMPAIKKQVAKKVLGALQNLAQTENEKYLDFYQNFGAVLKEGFHYDNEQHEALAELVRFKSNRTGPNRWVSFKEYIERKGENQKDIYYITGSSFDAVASSPHLEELVSKGLEVLFLIDPIDEWFLMSYPKFGEYSLKPVHKGDLDVSDVGTTPEDQKKEDELPPETLAGLIEMFRSHLGDSVKDVKISKRLRESPCCLVADEQGMSAQMERMMKAMGQAMPASKPILEINPTHSLIQGMSQRQGSATSEQMKEWVEVLYDTALLSEGNAPRNPGDFAKRITRVLEQATGTP